MYRPYQHQDLYPVRKPQSNSTADIKATHPTKEEFEAVDSKLLDPNQFTLISNGRLCLYQINPLDKDDKKFIAYIQFTRSDELSQEEVHDINFTTEFLHESKEFVSTVKSRKIFRGKMWTIGWRKSQTKGEMAGRYLDSVLIVKNIVGYMENLLEGITAGNMIYKLFNSIANTAVKSAQDLLKSLNLPAFQDPNWKENPTEDSFASNLAFTQDGFSNRPHADKDTSNNAFLFLCNTNKQDGSLSLDGHRDPTFSGPLFVFPDHQVAVDLRKLDGVCRIVFAAGQFRHFTHNVQPDHEQLTSFGFSLQTTKSCTDAFKRICSNFYKEKSKENGVEYYIGDHDHILKKAKEKK